MKKFVVLLAVAAIFSGVYAGSVFDLQEGDAVKAVLGSGLVVPKVGGITLSVDGLTYGDSSADVYVGGDAVWAGCYVVDIYDMSDNLIADQYASFCMDATKDPVWQSPLEHAVTDNVAAHIECMWGTYYDSAIYNAVTAAAFQLAVWEIVHETAGCYDMSDGSFFLAGLNPSSSYNNGATFNGLIAQANAYLDCSSWTTQASLLSLERDGYQPLPIETPEPATIAILGIGGALLIGRKR